LTFLHFPHPSFTGGLKPSAAFWPCN